jgi:hypothetical protein
MRLVWNAKNMADGLVVVVNFLGRRFMFSAIGQERRAGERSLDCSYFKQYFHGLRLHSQLQVSAAHCHLQRW